VRCAYTYMSLQPRSLWDLGSRCKSLGAMRMRMCRCAYVIGTSANKNHPNTKNKHNKQQATRALCKLRYHKKKKLRATVKIQRTLSHAKIESCFKSPASSGRPVALICAVMLVVSSWPLRNAQQEFGERFICA
jgi:hypothetical protein